MPDIQPWNRILEGEVDTAKNHKRVAFTLDGVVQHIITIPSEVAALFVEKPEITLLETDSTVRIGQKIL